MRLADFILENIEPILQQWEDFAKTMTPAANGMDSVALRDHAEQMLLAIAADLRTAQSVKVRIAKSHGKASPSRDATPAETHADIRYSSGFTMAQVIAEYRALRTSVLMFKKGVVISCLGVDQVSPRFRTSSASTKRSIRPSPSLWSAMRTPWMPREMSFSAYWATTCEAPSAPYC